MPLVPLKIPPGMFRNGTAFQSYGRWYTGNLVRWFEGTMQPIGGWLKADITALAGKARGMFGWKDSSAQSNVFVAIGTNSNLYIESSGSAYDVTPAGFTTGLADSFPGTGYGYGSYNGSTYGTARSSSVSLQAAAWSFDNWGQYLVGVSTGDGKVYQWNLNTATAAAAVAGAPTSNRGVFVTPERYMVLLGAGGDPRNVQWCNQEDNTTWTPTATNTAGALILQTDGVLLGGKKLPGITLINSDTDCWIMTYLGPPLVYGFMRAGVNCGAFSGNAVGTFDASAVWMGRNGFFVFNGATVQSLPCDVFDYVFGDLNYVQRAKIYAGRNSKFREMWWFYPSASATENDRYVIWNWAEGHWTTGTLARTCWADVGVTEKPLAVDPSGYVQQHETGWTNNGAALTTQRFAQSGPVDIYPGDQIMNILQVLPDELTSGQVQARFATKFAPEGTEYNYGPYPFGSAYVDVRFQGRQIATKIEALADADWRIGTIRLDARKGSKR